MIDLKCHSGATQGSRSRKAHDDPVYQCLEPRRLNVHLTKVSSLLRGAREVIINWPNLAVGSMLGAIQGSQAALPRREFLI